jgi:seryl-tRNA synthetase
MRCYIFITVQFDSDQKNKEMNALQKEIGKKYKAKEDPSELLAKKAELQKSKEELVAKAKDKETSWKNKLNTLGNIVHASVPTSMDEDNNEIIRTYFHNGVEPVKRTDILSHHEVLTRLDGYDQERGAKVAGHRGYFLTSVGVDLNLALISYGLNFLGRHGYKKLQTPFFMNKEMMAKTAQLSQFDEELYKVNPLLLNMEKHVMNYFI